MGFIDAKGREALRQYSYSGTDSSLYYIHIIDPLAEGLVRLYPTWLAPNVITLTGLALVCLAHLAMCWHCPSLSSEAPPWVYAFAGLSLAAYQLLDASDGKQARRTGSGTALGMMLDHGCDAVNIVVSGVTMVATLQMDGWQALALLSASATVFHVATVEELLLGSLDLPGPINGPNEGLLIMYAAHLHAAVYGPGSWGEELVFGLRRRTAFLLAALACCGTTLLGAHLQRFVEKGLLARAARAAAPYFCTLALTFAWLLLEPEQMDLRPRAALWVYGLTYSLLTTRTILAHILRAEPPPLWSLDLLPLLLLAARAALGGGGASCVHLAALALAARYGHLVLSLGVEMRDALGVAAFSIAKAE